MEWRRGGRWRGWRPSILSLNFDSALGITVHGGRKIRWRSPTAIRLSRGQDMADATRVQGERQGSLPTLRQLPWSCDPDATNGSLRCLVRTGERSRLGPSSPGVLRGALEKKRRTLGGQPCAKHAARAGGAGAAPGDSREMASHNATGVRHL